MKISTRGRYGVRVMIELAARFGEGPVQMSTIARTQSVSRKYMHSLLTALKTAGLVQSTRGAAGGYVLTREPSTITVSQVVRVLEGSLAPVECVGEGNACKKSDYCVARQVWWELGQAMEKVLADITLQQLVERQERTKPGSAMFDI